MNAFIFRSVRLISAALRAARPAKPVARERQAASFNQLAEVTEIAARSGFAGCFFAAFCQAPAAGRLRAGNPQIAARNPRFPQGVARGESKESVYSSLFRGNSAFFVSSFAS